MTSGIYKLTNTINGKSYIGQSWEIENRWSNHSRRDDLVLHKAIKKYGWDNFTKEILIIVDNQEDLDLYETKCMQIYNTLAPSGYNLKEGGRGGKHTEISKKKMSDALKGNIPWNKGLTKYTDLRMAQISESNTGKTHTQAAKDKVSKANSGRIQTSKSNNQRSETLKGKYVGEKNSISKMTNEKVKELRELFATGKYSSEDLAKKYNIHARTVRNIIHYDTWKHI